MCSESSNDESTERLKGCGYLLTSRHLKRTQKPPAQNNHCEMTEESKTSVTLTEEEEYSDDESYQWSEHSDIDSYLS